MASDNPSPPTPPTPNHVDIYGRNTLEVQIVVPTIEDLSLEAILRAVSAVEKVVGTLLSRILESPENPLPAANPITQQMFGCSAQASAVVANLKNMLDQGKPQIEIPKFGIRPMLPGDRRRGRPQ